MSGKLNTNAQSNNTFYYIAGNFENIVCSWSGDELQKLEWFLEGVESLPIVSEVNTSSLTLSPDPSTDGLNGTTFICRATTERGDIFETNILLHIRGNFGMYLYIFIHFFTL